MYIAVIGDIHGRFHRVHQWLATLESSLAAPLDLVLAVGDIEAYGDPARHRERAARRAMTPEFAGYANGEHSAHRPVHFIGGNNEDFATLHAHPKGATFPGGVHYLGRVGDATLAGLHVAWLSGIHAPRWVDTPLLAPATPDLIKQAGYFRRDEIDAARTVRDVDVMLVHEWPRGLVARARAEKHGIHRRLRAYRFPWIGNPLTRELVAAVEPAWLFCGHSHIALATAIEHASGRHTNVACLDQAARPDGAIFWLEWSRGSAKRAGWGIDGNECWRAGETWDESRTPSVGDDAVEAEAKRPRAKRTPSPKRAKKTTSRSR
jgi:lariat debranching enzyme